MNSSKLFHLNVPVFKMLCGKEELLCLLYVIKLCECGFFVIFMVWLDELAWL